jgi:hypothetical protein
MPLLPRDKLTTLILGEGSSNFVCFLLGFVFVVVRSAIQRSFSAIDTISSSTLR